MIDILVTPCPKLKNRWALNKEDLLSNRSPVYDLISRDNFLELLPLFDFDLNDHSKHMYNSIVNIYDISKDTAMDEFVNNFKKPDLHPEKCGCQTSRCRSQNHNMDRPLWRHVLLFRS